MAPKQNCAAQSNYDPEIRTAHKVDYSDHSCRAQGVFAFLCSMKQLILVLALLRFICFHFHVFSAYDFATDTAMGSGRTYERRVRSRRVA